MGTWLDIIGSVIVGSLALMLLLRVNFQVSNNSREISTNGMVQSNLSGLGVVVEYDLYKIGYRVPSSTVKITSSGLNQLTYLADTNYSRDVPTVVHTIKYYLGDTSQAHITSNPNDKPLFKSIDNVSRVVALVRDCQFTYFDSTGVQISDTSVNGRKLIRIVKVYMKAESADLINNYYQTAEYTRKIKPMNLK
ncbi:MAG: hypothetical protein P4L27_07810 [Ignavibacteriaceae bacterium]|nr:hypothetical protein [Ignavibacteriaceae bacterium]